MAWNTIEDVRHNCRECNRYRIMFPEDLHRKEVVLDGLNRLQSFFGKKMEEFTESTNPPMEPVLITKKNKELCLQLIQECRECNRLVDRVNKEIILLK